jgi:hypothetical protein
VLKIFSYLKLTDVGEFVAGFIITESTKVFGFFPSTDLQDFNAFTIEASKKNLTLPHSLLLL